MNPLLDLVLRVSVILAAGLLFDVVMRSSAAALRHFVLAASLGAALAVVPLSLVVPAWEVAVTATPSAAPLAPPRGASAAVVAMTTPGTSPASATTRPPLLALAWFAGFAVAAASLLAGIYRLTVIARGGRRSDHVEWNGMAREIAATYGIRREVQLLETGAPDLLAT